MFGQTPTCIGLVCPYLVKAFLSDENWRAFISFGFQEFGTHSFIFTILISVFPFFIKLLSCIRCCCFGFDLRHCPHSICVPSSALRLCDVSEPSPKAFPASFPHPLCFGQAR